MKRHLTSLLLVLALCLGLAMPASAAEGEKITVGDQTYEALLQAIMSETKADSVTARLDSEVTLTAAIVIGSSDYNGLFSEPMTVTAKNVTVDLNGFTLTAAAGCAVFEVQEGYTLTVVGGGTGTGGFYAGANRFTLTCDGLDGNYSLVLLLKEGENQADGTKGIPNPTENNLQYIDQQNIAAQKAKFTLFPKSLEKGVYNVYVSTDKVTLKKVASFEYGEKPKYRLGDVDNDGEIAAYDASLILQHTVNLIDLTGNPAADVDKDGEIAAYDASMILQYLVKLIETLD